MFFIYSFLCMGVILNSYLPCPCVLIFVKRDLASSWSKLNAVIVVFFKEMVKIISKRLGNCSRLLMYTSKMPGKCHMSTIKGKFASLIWTSIGVKPLSYSSPLCVPHVAVTYPCPLSVYRV